MNRLLLGLLGLLLVRSSLAEVNAQSIAFNCRNCHHPTTSETALPALEQLSPVAMRQMLLDYKYDQKPATLMSRIAKGYSDQELSAVADWLGKD